MGEWLKSTDGVVAAIHGRSPFEAVVCGAPNNASTPLYDILSRRAALEVFESSGAVGRALFGSWRGYALYVRVAAVSSTSTSISSDSAPASAAISATAAALLADRGGAAVGASAAAGAAVEVAYVEKPLHLRYGGMVAPCIGDLGSQVATVFRSRQEPPPPGSMRMAPPSRERVGSVREEFGGSIYSVLGARGEPLYRIVGESLDCFLLHRVCDFAIFAAAEAGLPGWTDDETPVGYLGRSSDIVPDRPFGVDDSVALTFPRDSPLDHRLLLLAAYLMIVRLHFEPYPRV